MTVVDVGLLTGFKVDENDLSKVKMLSDCKKLIEYTTPETESNILVFDVHPFGCHFHDLIYFHQLSKGKEKYIERFEMNTELSDRGSLIIFLNKVNWLTI